MYNTEFSNKRFHFEIKENVGIFIEIGGYLFYYKEKPTPLTMENEIIQMAVKATIPASFPPHKIFQDYLARL